MALLDGARLLNPVYRPGFLDAAAEQLMRKPSLDEHEVRQTVREVLRRIDLWQARGGAAAWLSAMNPADAASRASNRLSILDCVDSPHLFAPHFKDPATWAAWRCFLKTVFGHSLTEAELELFQQCTGRQQPNRNGYLESWLCIGRRGGKSFTLALIAVYLALFRDWRHCLTVGEVGTVMVVAADRKQARTILRYAKGLISSVPMLAREVVGETAESISLRNRVTIEVHACSFRSVRGYSILVALLDEVAFWTNDEDSAEPDSAVLEAIKPGMATIPGAMLLVASSPYARKGILWSAHREHYGKDNSPALMWKAPTVRMNPLPKVQEFVDKAYAEDPISAAAEYGAEFRTDIEAFVLREAVEACTSVGVRERLRVPGVFGYKAFVDPSGGSSDSMTLAIAHRDRDLAVLDCVREIRPPFSPEAVVNEFATLLKSYGIVSVTGDRYAGEWPREQFRKLGIAYEPSEKPKSELYLDFLPLLNSRTVDLLDHARLLNQLIALERRTARSGRDTIDHAPGGHDDVANAVAGVLTQVAAVGYSVDLAWVDGDDDLDGAMRAYRRMELQAQLVRPITGEHSNDHHHASTSRRGDRPDLRSVGRHPPPTARRRRWRRHCAAGRHGPRTNYADRWPPAPRQPLRRAHR